MNAPLAGLARRTRSPAVTRDAGDRFGDIELTLFVAAVGERPERADVSIMNKAAFAEVIKHLR